MNWLTRRLSEWLWEISKERLREDGFEAVSEPILAEAIRAARIQIGPTRPLNPDSLARAVMIEVRQMYEELGE